ncbi:Amine oxidase family, flavin-containing [Sulfitobacter noctilucicola]|uniref:Monoamine oxidase n=1 Tax=Sulfitobacter noctilucicola TaxID=1342301 RepID=A0A7W6Q247_9RHOB|nr:FAD-dependent oxidoreductase [Sulfitobacter noctilucicola]KIN62737.1 Amine oxidase family, flavin-containing [Sulfitobacter noctilucicola]MBB4172730.1 monoamine oxidase [Sulfitobacter noctilucicola]
MTQTLIIGAGLSGLRVAQALEAQSKEYQLVDARDRLGGRINAAHYQGAAFDLGPAWFWQGQPRIATLINQLGLQVFEQYAQGDLMYEDGQGQVQRGQGMSAMQGSLRVAGGFTALVEALAQSIPQRRIRLKQTATAIRRIEERVEVTFADGSIITAERIVFAMPPRLVGDLRFDPVLPDKVTTTFRNVPTWMAGQAKALAIYDAPFWREAGLSGDAMSRRGPMVEIHDASAMMDGPYALFGFIGVPPAMRTDQTALKGAVIEQLGRLFGAQALTPAKFIIADWAQAKETATQADQMPLMQHPVYGFPPALDNLWDGRLQFAGTEVAQQFGGYLEGALEAAEDVLLRMGE